MKEYREKGLEEYTRHKYDRNNRAMSEEEEAEILSRFCLLATKGHPKRISRNVRQIIDTPVERHSRKPDEARRRIVELMGDVPRIELFALEKTEGWNVFGDEVVSDIIL